jgi:hypothetical protein
MGVVAAGTTIALLAGEVGRVWRRGSAPMPRESDSLVFPAVVAVEETVEVARRGYEDAPERANALFNMLVSFVGTFMTARGIAFLLRSRPTVGPFRDLHVAERHVHHYVPGIALAFVSGAVAILTDNEEIEPKLAIGFGAGMGLTLDESALLLELEDVYWTEEGLLSVQITLAVTALLGALGLGVRFLRRGEQLVLEESDDGVA